MVERKYYSKVPGVMELPDLLEIQLKSYSQFLQQDVPNYNREDHGLHGVFSTLFPVEDSKGYYTLEYDGYKLGVPKYTLRECKERGMTFAAPLKVDMSLSVFDKDGKEKKFLEKISNEVYIGEIPLMTDRGTFVINGAERVIVSQLHRSPGIVFNEVTLPTGKTVIGARIIPQRGSWVELMLDSDNMLWVNIDRRKKMPASILLRALGVSSNEDIIALFSETKKIKVTKTKPENLVGKILASPIVNEEDGDILLDAGETIDSTAFEAIVELGTKNVTVVAEEESLNNIILAKTLLKDETKTEEDALFYIYQSMRPGPPPNVETARNLITRLFFDDKRYDLGNVGRHRLNTRLNVASPEGMRHLQKDDFIETLRYLMRIANGDGYLDDIDHLGNRRVRSVGELMETQFAVGITRMVRTVREQLNMRGTENIVPHDLISARTVATVIQSFFGSSQLSQFLDQTNPLSELTHKRRVSALGPGGLTRERAGFEVRDVHHTHYGRLCPIETPEGPNIGLIASLSTYARVNNFGFIETPYQEVVDGKVTGNIVYLSADEEDGKIIVPSDTQIDKDGTLTNKEVFARDRGDFLIVPRTDIAFMDISPMQMVSVSAGLIPFLEHDDANRALMGSNMQRQAVPLIQTDSPLVGTGMEKRAAIDSGCLVIAQNDGVIESIDANAITIRKDHCSEEDAILGINELEKHLLTKFERSNQDTCINQHICAKEGQKVKKGDVLADGHATSNGELALGKNILVAYMPWNGYNYEDAIIVSEELVSQDVYTSLHIVVYETEVRETKRGPEELTAEIPNVSEEAVVNLDELGIITIGTEVEAGDILVGKVTPKGEKELSPEERLLRAIFGEKAGDVRDSSLKAPSGLKGIVVDTHLYSRKERDKKSKDRDKLRIGELQSEFGGQISSIEEKLVENLAELLKGETACEVTASYSDDILIENGSKWSKKAIKSLDVSNISFKDGICKKKDKNELSEKVFYKASSMISKLEDRLDKEIDKILRGDELKPGVLQLVKVYVAKKRKLSVGDKMAGRHGNKGIVSIIVPRADMPYLPDGTPIQMILNPLGVPSRMNVGQIFEVHMGVVADDRNIRIATPVFDGASSEEVMSEMDKVEQVRNALPTSDPKNPDYQHGKVRLRDGRSGEHFDSAVTVGPVYMLKLNHLIDDKMHARSIGPYSLVTQQPLGGKSQFGGQRFGEMEVWALEAYGAAYTLQQMLTVKSDDLNGRSKIYEAIVKGENAPETGVPESFNVLIREMKALCINVDINVDDV
jgi:DNA-directed RNA polymerase subunit beta